MAAKRSTSANVLLIGILGMLAVGTWVIFDIYRALTATTLTEVQQRQLQPLRVDIGDELIARLQARRQFDQLTLNTVQSVAVPGQETGPLVIETTEEEAEITPTPTPTAQEAEATESAQLETEIATESASP